MTMGQRRFLRLYWRMIKDNGRVTAAWRWQNYTLAKFQPKDVCVPKGLDNTDNGRVTAAWRGQNYTLAKFQPKDVCVPKGFDNRANGRVTAAFHYVTAFFCWAVTRCDNCLENEEQSVRLVLSGRHKGPSG